MKRTIFLAAIAVLMLSACGRPFERVSTEKNYRINFGEMDTNYAYVGVFTDPETGCQSYITDDGFMSPRLNPDGTQRCAAPSQPAS